MTEYRSVAKTYKEKFPHVFKDFKLASGTARPAVYNVCISRCMHCLIRESEVKDTHCAAHADLEKVVQPSLSFQETAELNGKTLPIMMVPSGLYLVNDYKDTGPFYETKDPVSLKSNIILLPKKGEAPVFKANLKTGLMLIKKNNG